MSKVKSAGLPITALALMGFSVLMSYISAIMGLLYAIPFGKFTDGGVGYKVFIYILALIIPPFLAIFAKYFKPTKVKYQNLLIITGTCFTFVSFFMFVCAVACTVKYPGTWASANMTKRVEYETKHECCINTEQQGVLSDEPTTKFIYFTDCPYVKYNVTDTEDCLVKPEYTLCPGYLLGLTDDDSCWKTIYPDNVLTIIMDVVYAFASIGFLVCTVYAIVLRFKKTCSNCVGCCVIPYHLKTIEIDTQVPREPEINMKEEMERQKKEEEIKVEPAPSNP
ncbi:hypothetical protein EIN_287730 [Entamoeba invadens IP1]|uniref:Uncharacterized protein n=1 Tax=Entamoeba invadens IP1 TaxID=370355 RepID=A0A0A1U4Z2_ENTIV|nr:hypothetical protein EIN_287730 [Entamoeba invadens IP1]ELP89347.1 hypothetical protein EIN_287730 [Entamoeba invadens IP1]|eukprot:XP_004256118.1 hypothetical protein EIN_287730 [Entamoeba invadens IP1]